MDPLTLQKVKGIIKGFEEGITIEEMGEQMGPPEQLQEDI